MCAGVRRAPGTLRVRAHSCGRDSTCRTRTENAGQPGGDGGGNVKVEGRGASGSLGKNGKGRPCRGWAQRGAAGGFGEQLDRVHQGHRVHEGQRVLMKGPSGSGQGQ